MEESKGEPKTSVLPHTRVRLLTEHCQALLHDFEEKRGHTRHVSDRRESISDLALIDGTAKTTLGKQTISSVPPGQNLGALRPKSRQQQHNFGS